MNKSRQKHSNTHESIISVLGLLHKAIRYPKTLDKACYLPLGYHYKKVSSSCWFQGCSEAPHWNWRMTLLLTIVSGMFLLVIIFMPPAQSLAALKKLNQTKFSQYQVENAHYFCYHIYASNTTFPSPGFCSPDWESGSYFDQSLTCLIFYYQLRSFVQFPTHLVK